MITKFLESSIYEKKEGKENSVGGHCDICTHKHTKSIQIFNVRYMVTFESQIVYMVMSDTPRLPLAR